MIDFFSPSDLDLMMIIEALKKEMIQVGLNEGLLSEKTIKISQQLDCYINYYQNQTNTKR